MRRIAEALRPRVAAGQSDVVHELMTTSDVAFGPWHLENAGDKGVMVIKGAGLIEIGARSGNPLEATASAVPCACAAASEAGMLVLRDGARDGRETINETVASHRYRDAR